MVRYPEILQFRVLRGTSAAVARVAAVEGKSPAALMREALDQRIAAGERSTLDSNNQTRMEG